MDKLSAMAIRVCKYTQLQVIELSYQHPFHLLITNVRDVLYRILDSTFGNQIVCHKMVMIKGRYLFRWNCILLSCYCMALDSLSLSLTYHF